MDCTSENILAFLREHKQDFAREYAVKRIGIFGSTARGEASPRSDIDVVVELAKVDLFFLIGVKQAIEDQFGRKVDIVRLRNGMNQALRARIERDAIYV